VTVPVIDLDATGRTYPGPPRVAALLPCRLTVGRGEYVTVMGRSGSGKSTLLNLVGLLDRPSEGRYLLDGIDTADLPERDRAALRGRRIGFVFQAFHLLARRTAADNVMLGAVYTGTRRSARQRLAGELLGQVGLGHRAAAPAAQLSGGERQRVAIARALVNRPSLLLCDEPTGNLDSGTAAGILAIIDNLHRDGLTVVVVTHDAQVAARGDRCLTMHDGTLTELPAGRAPAGLGSAADGAAG
jgi:putative ABC transport system ATP-binding protein